MDIWREHNPNGIEYTHISSTNATRVDQILCNKINANAYKVKHKILGNFDHRGMQLIISNRAIWGKGLWKLNTKLIERKENKTKIKETIQTLKEEKYRMEPLQRWDYFKTKMTTNIHGHRK